VAAAVRSEKLTDLDRLGVGRRLKSENMRRRQGLRFLDSATKTLPVPDAVRLKLQL